MHAFISSQQGIYVVMVQEDGVSPRPFANFGWHQGAAIETRDLINDGRIKYERICGMIRKYDPNVFYGYPNYWGDNRVDFPRRRKQDGEVPPRY